MRSLFLLILLFSSSVFANPDWSEGALLPEGLNRENIYNLSNNTFKEKRLKGYEHALKWPVDVTGLVVPENSFKSFFYDERPPILIKQAKKVKSYFKSGKEFFKWLGLNSYPEEGPVVNPVPQVEGHDKRLPMGASFIETPLGKGLTFSCANCHSGEFMGKSVLGLTNKRARNNQLFTQARKWAPLVPSFLYKEILDASKEEVSLFKYVKKNLKSVGSVNPKVLGLDTSLPHVSLSLARREQGLYAAKSKYYERFPRPNRLEHEVADSKPMPWFTLKYKTRWLSDGSVVSGNPVLTNLLWNEIGRGTDLEELEDWMKENTETVEELTTAVFSTKAPHWTDFFPLETLNLSSAKKGEVLFNQSCKKCHGEYIKNWSREESSFFENKADIFKTAKVIYSKKTRVKDVGTDPQRWKATSAFSDRLNSLAISKWMGTVVKPQKGYVPPPLNGVFSRYPYLHNNSVPSLCALLEDVPQRPRFFIQGPSKSQGDYDMDCVGYPVGDKIPTSWKKDKEAYYNVGSSGLKNIGHTRMLKDKFTGKPKFSKEDKKDLIEFLKTL